MPAHHFTKMNKKKSVKPSSSSQQRTLFQTWGSKVSSGPSISSKTSETDNSITQFQLSPDCNNNSMDEDDDDDKLLMQALEESTNLSREIGTTSFELQDDNDPIPEIDLSSIPDLPGFDKFAGQKWIYPTNYPVRAYQFDIVKSALFQNTLVALPTGLGKTFIGAVVMFNFYRWYPLGKIVFMAPTKPLVMQQIEACYNIMGIPQSDIAEMTGKMLPVSRQKAWKEKRVIFLTPQVLSNDLSRGTCEADKIKCLVVDEAHKSLGNYAYCQVVKELVKINREFRILALSATPGSNLTMIQDVISNLLISKIELRTDDSAEIKIYSFERKVEKIVVPLGEELKNIEKQYLALLESVVNRLVREKVLYKRNVKSLSKFLILKCRDEFRQNPPQHLQSAQKGIIEGDFALSMSLYHGYELLQLHGLRSFYQYLHSLINGDKGYGRTRSDLMKNMNFMNIYEYLTNKFGDRPSIPFTQQTSQEKSEQYVIGHPKLEKLQEIVLEHFRKFQKEDGSSDTRVMIFSQYRNSVSDITEMLKRQQPLVKVISFMGQAMKKETKGFTQKEQLRVMKEFRDGNYNTLVSTCVGEEGLDIGDVDLIICFDASKSPIRLVQRMGRTGRKRDGRIVMLVTEGKEDQIYKQSQYNKNSINKALLNGTKSLRYYQESPRMLPNGLVPQCHKMHITIKKEFENSEKEKTRKKEEKKKKIVKRKRKTIPELLSGESSVDGKLIPVSNSKPPIQKDQLTAVENSSMLIGLEVEDNLRISSSPSYITLSDNELPDLSPQKNVSRMLKVAVDTNKKKQSNFKTTKKKSVQKEKPPKKKIRKKQEAVIESIFTIPDDDSASDFLEEPEAACDLPILDDNGTNKSIFKSQTMNSSQELLKSTYAQESKKSGLSKNNTVKNSLVPVAPSLENVSELLDDLKAQGLQRNSLNLFSLVDAWDAEFHSKVNPAGILASSWREEMYASIQATSPLALASGSVSENEEVLCLSSRRLGLDINDKECTGNLDLGSSTVIVSPQRNHQISETALPDLSRHNKKSSCSKEIPIHITEASPVALVSSSICQNNEERFSCYNPERRLLTNVNDKESMKSKVITSSQQRCLSSQKLDFEHRKRKLLFDDTSESKRYRSLESSEGEGDEKNQSGSLNASLVTKSIESLSPNLNHHAQRLSSKDVISLESQNCRSSEICKVRHNETVHLIPFDDDPQGSSATQKNVASAEPVTENSKLVESYGDLFTDFSLSFNDATEMVNKSGSLPEQSKDQTPESQNQNPELPALQASRNSNIFNEELCDEDDHPIFDLTTDMFSEDELDDDRKKSDGFEVPASNLNSVPKSLSEINAYRSTDPVVGRSGNTPNLSSLIVSFVNTKIPTPVVKSNANETDDDDLPQFDLGFDFEVIPPTPELGKTCSFSTKRLQSNMGASTPIPVQNKLISTSELCTKTENRSSVFKKENSFSSSEEEELGGFRCVLPALDITGHLQQHSTPFLSKKNSSEEVSICYLNGKLDSSPLYKNEDNNISQSSFVSEGFDLKLDDVLDSDHLTESDVSTKLNKKETNGTVDDEEEEEDSFCVRKKKKKSLMLTSPLVSNHTDDLSANETKDDEEEDSFCVRKKKKKSVMLMSPLISNDSDSDDDFEILSQQIDTPKSSFARKKEKSSHHKRISFLDDEVQSEDDFITDESKGKQLPAKRKKTLGKGKKPSQRSHSLRKQNDKLYGHEFLDDEAVLSGSDDDDDDGDLDEAVEDDSYEHSFINDFSQINPTQNTVDMRAVYLQSVVSPVAKHHGYKLKYGHRKLSDVYSCPPESDDDYECDSFCVESDEESSLAENTVFEESLHVKKTPKKNVGKKSRSRRVIRLVSSSDEDEQDKNEGKVDDIFRNPGSKHTMDVANCNEELSAEVVSKDKRNGLSPKLDSHSDNQNNDDLEPLVIFADSREISSAQEIISDLRIQHKLNVVVTKLDACDYIVSLRTAVERKLMSDFVNGANNKKLVKRLQDMCEYYERPCLIVERNPQKGHDSRNVPRPIMHTKYLETLLSQLSLSSIRLLFSDSKIETCKLLASLCCQEKLKGQAIPKNQVLTDGEQQKLKFFLTLPKLNHALALNLCKNFKTIKEFLESSVSLIVTRSKMSPERANYLHKFIRLQFR